MLKTFCTEHRVSCNFHWNDVCERLPVLSFFTLTSFSANVPDPRPDRVSSITSRTHTQACCATHPSDCTNNEVRFIMGIQVGNLREQRYRGRDRPPKVHSYPDHMTVLPSETKS